MTCHWFRSAIIGLLLGTATASCAHPSGKGRRGFVGITLREPAETSGGDSSLTGEAGALVMGVAERGPAATAGLVPGDRIVRVDGVMVDHRHGAADLIAQRRPGEVVVLEIERDGARHVVHVTLATGTRAFLALPR